MKPKEIEESKLTITKVVKQEFDEAGNVTAEYTMEEVADKPISLGSVNKPNKSIKRWRYDVPEKPRREKDPLTFFLDKFK